MLGIYFVNIAYLNIFVIDNHKSEITLDGFYACLNCTNPNDRFDYATNCSKMWDKKCNYRKGEGSRKNDSMLRVLVIMLHIFYRTYIIISPLVEYSSVIFMYL